MVPAASPSSDSKDRVALITGGGTGIGRCVCEQLAAAGVGTVLVNYSRSADDAGAVVEHLEQAGCRSAALRADVADAAAVAAMFDTITNEYGQLDYLVNNAATTELIPFPDLDAVTDEIWDKLLGVNVVGTFNCSRAAAPLLKRTGLGAIVNVGSIAATRGIGSSIPYGASKAAVLQLTRGLAMALAPEVRVNSVSAGTVRTRWHNRLSGEEKFAERAEALGKEIPLGRIAEPEDIAEAIVFLLFARFVTGQDLLVDGGKAVRY